MIKGDDTIDTGDDLKGVISFAIQELCLESPGKPRVESNSAWDAGSVVRGIVGSGDGRVLGV